MGAVARIRRRTHEVLEIAKPGDELSRTIDGMIMALVLLNVVAVILESVGSIEARYRDLFTGFERISVVVFSTELVCRVWAAAEAAQPSESARRARLRYLRSPMALADLAAVLPWYLATFTAVDLRFLRMLRLLRLLKLTRYSTALARMIEVVRLQRHAFGAALLILSMVVIFTASAIYVVEGPNQPEAFGSIPDAMWWAIVTLTTVGYGDVTPITPLGKLMASLISIVGIGMVALPTSLLASGFSHIMSRNREALQEEMDLALEDGELSPEEIASYEELAHRLHVDPEVADEIFQAALAHYGETRDRSHCPHCGKSLEV
jgi:voltage-gated potassium channel